MSFLITALVLILLAVVFVFLGVGLVLVLGLVLMIAALVAVFSMIFGDGSSSYFVQVFNKGDEIPQKFNQCLIEEEPEICLKDWTHWDKDKIELVKQLAKQVRQDLGARGRVTSSSYQSETIQGLAKVRLELVTDFEKKQKVHETYVLLNKNGDLKIEELTWDY